jgi:ABC-type glucose/galactose transport system permease subunit
MNRQVLMMKLSVKEKRRASGFTLSELLIASSILLIAILGLLALLINCVFMNELNNNLVIGVNDVQYVLEEIKNLSYNQINSYISSFNSSRFTNLNNEQVTFPTHNIGTNIAEITVRVSWKVRGKDKYTDLSTLIAK